MAHQTNAMRGDGIEQATTTKRGEWQSDGTRHAVDVSTPQEYRDAVDAANTLDLELVECVAVGRWKTHPDEIELGYTPLTVEVSGNGRKWFNITDMPEPSPDTMRAKPRPRAPDTHGELAEGGALRLRFD
jgi:hypothetical protein